MAERPTPHVSRPTDEDDIPADEHVDFAPPTAPVTTPIRLFDARTELAVQRRPEPLRVRIGPPEAAEDTNPGLRLYAGRYRIEDDLPSPPLTSRQMAVQEPAVRRVVLGVLRKGRPADAQEALESRFLKDARVLARLRHPSLAAVHDVGRAADGTCFATEEVPFGPTIAALVASRSLPPDRILAIAVGLASALAALHEAGFVHRCLTADCVTVAPEGYRSTDAERVHLGGYGWWVVPEDIAGDEASARAEVWAPEVLAGEEPDEASDVYAVGVLLTLALTGTPARVGSADTVGGRLAGRLADVAQRCTAPAPENRYPSARALLLALEALARPAVVVPPPRGLPAAGALAAALLGAVLPTLALVAVMLQEPADTTPTAPPGTRDPAALRDPAAPRDPPAADPASRTDADPVPAATRVASEAPAAPAPSPRAAPTIGPTGSPDRPRPVPESARVAAPARPASATVAPVSATPVRIAPVSAAPVSAAPVSASTIAPPTQPLERPASAAAPIVPAMTQAPPLPAPSSGPSVNGAAALSGLWLGRAQGGTLAFDLVVSPDGQVSGRARRSDRTGEAEVSGRVLEVAGSLTIELRLTDAKGTETYRGEAINGQISGRIQAGGRPAGRFTARR